MKKLLLCLFVCAVTACNSKKQDVSYVNKENAITVSVPKPDYANQHLFDATKYADSVKFVRLETSDDNLIASISGLFFTDDYIIVFDRKTGSILFFDYDGNYSHKIRRRGRGNMEYLRLSHVMVDNNNKVIIVHDLDSKATLYYDFNGKPISKTSNFCNGMVARDIINLPSGDFLCYRQDKLGEELEWQAGVWKAKKDGTFDKFIYTHNFDYESCFVQYTYHLSQLPNGKISFVDQNQTAVFYIDGDVVYKRVQFKLPGKTEADFPGIKNKDKGDEYYTIASNQEKGDFIFTQWKDEENRVFETILTKSTGALEVGMTFSPFAFNQILPGGRFVKNNNPYIHSSWFSPSVLEQFIKNSPQLQLESKLKAQKLIEGIPSNQLDYSNPIIQLLYIKK